MKEQVREPIATWWRISRHRPEITPVEVVAYTASFVTFLENVSWWGGAKDRIRERREKRDDIFPTFDAAKNEIVRRAAEKVESSKQQLQRDRTFLGQVEALKEQS